MKWTKKLLMPAIISLAAATAYSGNKANPDAIELAPLPMPVEFKSDIDRPVTFDETTSVKVSCPDAAAVDWLSRHFAEWFGKNAPKVVKGDTRLTLKDGDEAYAVKADAAGVEIASRTLAGIRWAAYTIRQLLIAKRGTFKTAGYILPTLEISDAPHLSFRGIHLCWFPETDKEHIERYIRLAALMKFNYVVLEPWGMYKSERHPWWSWPKAKMTKSEVRRLVKIGKDIGVTLIPQIAAYGHASASRTMSLKHSVLDLNPEYEPLFEPGGWNWCLSNPETQRVIREIIVEMLEDFDNPPFIHLGCDEAQPPSCPECRKRPYGELVCQHISKLVAFTKERGARAMIWHDMLLEDKDPRWKGFIAMGSKLTASMVDWLPKDVVVCDWQYSNQLTEKQLREWPTIKYFNDKGFSVAGCPWRNCKAMQPMAKFLAGSGAFGYLQTTWHYMRGYDFTAMMRNGSAAAWGGTDPEGMPQFDTSYAILLRIVGLDAKIKDYRYTGRYDYQIAPAWWSDK